MADSKNVQGMTNTAQPGPETAEDRLRSIGLELPPPPVPNGSYTPFVQVDSQIYIAGQTCLLDGVLQYEGTVGVDLTLEQAKLAAQLCALNALATLKEACGGDLASVRAVKMTGFIRCDASYGDQPKVLDGASDILRLALGDRGAHVRAAIGTNSLPRRAPVEIETVFQVLVREGASKGPATASADAGEGRRR